MALNVPLFSYSWVVEQVPFSPVTTARLPSPKEKMHVKGPVPPVKVAVNVVTLWLAELNAAKLPTVRGVEEKV